jgi:hypothetical protein
VVLLSIFLIQGNVHLPGTPTYFHSRSIDYDCSHPSRHLRLAPELVKVCVGRQESVLDCIFGICCVARYAGGHPSEGGQTTGESVCQFLDFSVAVCRRILGIFGSAYDRFHKSNSFDQTIKCTLRSTIRIQIYFWLPDLQGD